MIGYGKTLVPVKSLHRIISTPFTCNWTRTPILTGPEIRSDLKWIVCSGTEVQPILIPQMSTLLPVYDFDENGSVLSSMIDWADPVSLSIKIGLGSEEPSGSAIVHVCRNDSNVEEFNCELNRSGPEVREVNATPFGLPPAFCCKALQFEIKWPGSRQ